MTPENGGGSHPPLQESEDAQDGNDAPRSRRGPSPPPRSITQTRVPQPGRSLSPRRTSQRYDSVTPAPHEVGDNLFLHRPSRAAATSQFLLVVSN